MRVASALKAPGLALVEDHVVDVPFASLFGFRAYRVYRVLGLLGLGLVEVMWSCGGRTFCVRLWV